MHYWVGNANKSWVSHQNVEIYLARPESMSFETKLDIETTSKNACRTPVIADAEADSPVTSVSDLQTTPAK